MGGSYVVYGLLEGGETRIPFYPSSVTTNDIAVQGRTSPDTMFEEVRSSFGPLGTSSSRRTCTVAQLPRTGSGPQDPPYLGLLSPRAVTGSRSSGVHAGTPDFVRSSLRDRLLRATSDLPALASLGDPGRTCHPPGVRRARPTYISRLLPPTSDLWTPSAMI